MKKLLEDQIESLMILKAMEDYIESDERFSSLNDVVDNILENELIDRDDFLYGVMELTNLGMVDSDIHSEQDIEDSEAVGYDIKGFTPEGNDYIEAFLKKQENIQKLKGFFKQCDELVGKLSETHTFKLIFGRILA